MAQQPMHAILFDRDETLLGTDMAAMDQLLTDMRVAVPQLSVEALMTQWEHWPGPWPHAIAGEPAFWDAFWTALAHDHGLPADTATKLGPFGAQYHTCFYAYADTLPCLNELRARFPDTRLALLTNFELPSVVATLETAQVDPAWFSLIVSSSMIGIAKPNPAAFQYVCDRLAVDPRACVFVDDLPANVTGAAALGMRGILIDRGDVYQQWPGERMHSLRELPTRLIRNNGNARHTYPKNTYSLLADDIAAS